MQLNQPAEEVVQEEIKPADISYTRDLALNPISPTASVSTQSGAITSTISPTKIVSQGIGGTNISTLSAVITSKLSPTKIPTPTLIRYPTLIPTTAYSRLTPTSIMTPTGINVVTTPIVTSTLAQTLVSGTRYPSPTTFAQTTARPTVNSLPSAGMFNTTLIIFAAAISMIFFSFLL